jgi:hypothetical protein
VTTAAGADDQQLIVYCDASMFTSFLVGLLAIARLARRERRHKPFVINLIRAIIIVFTLIVKSRPREAAWHRQYSRNRTQRRAP